MPPDATKPSAGLADGLIIPALAADLDVRGAGKLYHLAEAEVPELRILGVLIAASERPARADQGGERAEHSVRAPGRRPSSPRQCEKRADALFANRPSARGTGGSS